LQGSKTTIIAINQITIGKLTTHVLYKLSPHQPQCGHMFRCKKNKSTMVVLEVNALATKLPRPLMYGLVIFVESLGIISWQIVWNSMKCRTY
jgi:hypothetical protein